MKELGSKEKIDTVGLSTHIVEKLNHVDKSIKEYFEKINIENAQFKTDAEQPLTPCKRAFKEIWGCEATCPFCEEYCRYGNNHLKDGKNHSCVQHRPKDYKKCFPDWEISHSDVFDSSAYWMFLMNKFEKKLAKYHGLNRPDIPEHWKTITEQQAKDSLRNLKA